MFIYLFNLFIYLFVCLFIYWFIYLLCMYVYDVISQYVQHISGSLSTPFLTSSAAKILVARQGINVNGEKCIGSEENICSGPGPGQIKAGGKT